MKTGNRHGSSTDHRGIKARVAAALMGAMVLGATAAPASAQQFVGPDVVVGYADLDITTVAGAEQLFARIQQAAARVCPPADNQPLVQYMAALRCRNEVLARAVSSVGSPQVTAVFAARAHHWVRSPV
jgi:UrcA family protein